MNHIPLDRKHSRGWARSSSKSSSSETELPPPPKQSTPQASTQHMELDISEAERSWLPPLAFTEEDHTTKPENKAVGALLKEFVSLRRSVSDEYEIAEKVSVRRKTASVGPGDLPPKPDNDRLQKMGRKRLKVISEIMETEKTYQHHLDMIVKVRYQQNHKFVCLKFHVQVWALLTETFLIFITIAGAIVFTAVIKS